MKQITFLGLPISRLHFSELIATGINFKGTETLIFRQDQGFVFALHDCAGEFSNMSNKVVYQRKQMVVRANSPE